jgi:hypothetical protein
VIYGGMEAAGIAFEGVAEALAVPRSDIRLFGKPEPSPAAAWAWRWPTAPMDGGPRAPPSWPPARAPGAGLRRFEMKLLRYGPKGHEKPGLLDADGNIRDLSGLLDDITPAPWRPPRWRC